MQGNGDDRRPRSPDELWAGVVAEVAAMPDVVTNILREHRPNERGLCLGSGCGSPGRGEPIIKWPCALYTLAAAADAKLRGR